MKVKLVSNPKNAPCCVRLDIVMNNQAKRFLKGEDWELPRNAIPNLLFQVDYDFPFVAQMFGWSPKECQNIAKSCNHVHTDGTVRCQQCGTTAASFIASARDWLDNHDGKTIELDNELLNSFEV